MKKRLLALMLVFTIFCVPIPAFAEEPTEETVQTEPTTEPTAEAVQTEPMTEPAEETEPTVPEETRDADLLQSGACGEELTFTLEADGVLTIRGTGAMENYSRSLAGETFVTTAPWQENADTITAIVVEEGVTTIGDSAFYSCENLTSARLPGTLTALEANAFSGCEKLDTVSMAKGTACTIGDFAFAGCGSLRVVNLPGSITRIGRSAFQNCTGLTTLTMAKNSEDACILEDYAFYGCNALKNLRLRSTVTEIGERAFVGCNSLKTLKLPDGLTEVETEAFAGCGVLTTVIFGENPETPCELGDGVFRDCVSLRDVQFGKNVTAIGEDCFRDCIALDRIQLEEGLESLGQDAFSGTYISEITFPASLTDCGGGVCDTLETAIFADGCWTIPDRILQDARNVKVVEIPETVTKIGEKAFNGCSALKNLYLPAAVTRVDDSALDGSLCNLYYGGTEAQWAAVRVKKSNPDIPIHYGHTHDGEPRCVCGSVARQPKEEPDTAPENVEVVEAENTMAILTSHVTHAKKLTPDEQMTLDITGDGKITNADVVKLSMYLAHEISTL